MESGIIGPLVGLIALATIVLAWLRIRSEPHRSRGADPDKGYHELVSDYQSGLGGHYKTWRVPKDPQEYAKAFVPPHSKPDASAEKD